MQNNKTSVLALVVGLVLFGHSVWAGTPDSMDIVGVKLYDKRDDVERKIVAQFPELRLESHEGGIRGAPDVPVFHFGSDGNVRYKGTNLNQEGFELTYDTVQRDRLISIQRYSFYSRAEPHPSMESVDKAIKEKYGKPQIEQTFTDAKRYFWFSGADPQYANEKKAGICLDAARDVRQVLVGNLDAVYSIKKECGVMFAVSVSSDSSNRMLADQANTMAIDFGAVYASRKNMQEFLSRKQQEFKDKEKAAGDDVKLKF